MTTAKLGRAVGQSGRRGPARPAPAPRASCSRVSSNRMRAVAGLPFGPASTSTMASTPLGPDVGARRRRADLQLLPVREPCPHGVGQRRWAVHRHPGDGGLLAGRPVGHHLRGDQRDQRIDHQRKQHHHRQGAAVAQRLAQLLPSDEQDLSRAVIRRRSAPKTGRPRRTAGTPPPGWGPHRRPRAGRQGSPLPAVPPRYMRPIRSQSSSASAR